ncbi:MAG: APC family permease [Acidobacteria bacterium]|nr:APC family permease [Acidobacteriota bacterium]
MAAPEPPLANAAPELRRSVGPWDLTALGVNQVIGGAIFLIPAAIAQAIGTWSPIGFLLAGGAMLLIALCYAETASRFSSTGGAYVYTRAAFGRFAGFEIGWMQWFVRVSSQAAIVSGIANALAYYWPAANQSWRQVVIVSAITLLIGYWHVRGIRESAWAINFFAAAKLIPLVTFIGVGAFLVDWRSLAPLPDIGLNQIVSAGLLLVFAYGGFESVAVIAGETRHPRRDVPFGLGATMLCVTIVMTGAQAVYVGSQPANASSATPLADSAQALMGWAGAALMGAGSVISMLGNNAGSSLVASRMLFALAEQRDLPSFLARIHPGYRTPAVAICFSTAVTLVLAVSGSFVMLASTSALARLLTYTGVSLSTLVLRKRNSPAATFVLPFGASIPVAATVLSLAMIAGATREQFTAGGLALAAGAILYLCNNRARVLDEVPALQRAGGD